MATTVEKAKAFVTAVSDLHESLKNVDPSGANSPPQLLMESLTAFVQRLLVKQEEFKALNMCTFIDVGYHYTETNQVNSIRTHGLLTRSELVAKGIQHKYTGSSYGEGIYTCDDHKAHRNSYGQVCLLVARLKGPTSSVASDAVATYVSNSMVVLRSSAQCIPLVHFVSPPDDLVLRYHSQILSIFDLHFNGATASTTCIDKHLSYIAPEVLSDGVFEKITLVATSGGNTKEDCAICLCALGEQMVGQIQGCEHQFHYSCILEATSFSIRCPLCKVPIAEPQGTMPSGTMAVMQQRTVTCDTFAAGSIQINYQLYGGIQKPYHINPGVNYPSDNRTAYLPDNDEGRLLLKRLEYAFSHGLTFTVGTSASNGSSNVVTWTTIHHKTSPSGGSFGFPDTSFFLDCNEELDFLGVPSADSL